MEGDRLCAKSRNQKVTGTQDDGFVDSKAPAAPFPCLLGLGTIRQLNLDGTVSSTELFRCSPNRPTEKSIWTELTETRLSQQTYVTRSLRSRPTSLALPPRVPP